MKILAIDPGNIESGYAVIQMPEFKLLTFGKIENEELLDVLLKSYFYNCDRVAIEMVACYGMPVGKDVFDTCVWIGRFIQAIYNSDETIVKWNDDFINYIYRREEKLTLCGSPKAKDANIKQALVNRYAKHDFKSGKGTKKNPDTFYGVAKDAWQAIAVGVTYYEKTTIEDMGGAEE